MTLSPENFVVNSKSPWDLTLSPPIPLEEGCWVKIYLPNDLTFDYKSVLGEGFFQPDPDPTKAVSLLNFNQNDVLERDGEEVAYRSIVIEACTLEDKLGFSPQGSLRISDVSTPIAIKTSDVFFVEIYKDEALESMIAKIKSGAYIDASQLQAGVISDMYFKPRDTKVQ